MQNILNIAYTFHADNYQMLLVSIKSVLDNNKNNEMEFFLATCEKDLPIEFFDCIESYRKYENCKGVNLINIDARKYNSLKKYVHFDTDLFYFELPELINRERILCMSNYSIITGDLKELYNTCMKEAVGAVESPFLNDYVESINGVFYNANVLLIDCKKWIEKKYFQRLLNKDFTKYSPTSEQIGYWDCFNRIIDECYTLEPKYNYCEIFKAKLSASKEAMNAYKNFNKHKELPVVVSLLGCNPCGKGVYENSYLDLWWEYAKRTEIYHLLKEFNNVCSYKLQATSLKNSFNYGWLLKRIYPYIKPYMLRIILGFLIAIPLGLLDGVTAIALKPYMDYVVSGKDFVYSFHGVEISISSLKIAFLIPLAVILFAGLQGILKYLNGYISTWTSQRITNDVKFDLFDRLIGMHPQFFDDNSSGIVISRYMNDPTTASAGIVDQLKTITTSLFGALGLVAVMLYSSWQLAFIGILVLFVALIPVSLIRKRIRGASNKNMIIGGNITTNINETYSGNRVIAAYGLQKRQSEYFRKQAWSAFDVNMSLYKRAGWMDPMMYFIASIGIAAVLGVGTYLINSGHMTAGSFASFVTSLLLLYKPVKTLGGTLTGIQNLFVAMGRIFELFDLESAIKEKENPIELKGLNDCIEFRDVNFEYIPNKLVLKKINIKIPKNEKLAIVGNSGGGKSTLVNLIPRFYDIVSGSISIDGIDLRDLSLNSLRNNISMVFQDNFLFSGSIRENILMGKPDATKEEIEAVIDLAHLREMLEGLPEGLDTELGERGLTLSGGQRQRIAIARAMLRNAPIVILDEATSALDNESEAIVQKAMDNLMKNRTVFIIAHRLSTIKNADRIAVINEGELVELGCHEELMQIEEGQYKHLYEMQFKNQEAIAVCR